MTYYVRVVSSYSQTSCAYTADAGSSSQMGGHITTACCVAGSVTSFLRRLPRALPQ